MKLLALISLLIPTISFATQTCSVNVYDRINETKLYNHSSDGIVDDQNNLIGLRVVTDDYNVNSQQMVKQTVKLEEPSIISYYHDIKENVEEQKPVHVVKFIKKGNIKEYFIYDDQKGKSYLFFNCKEGTK